MTPERRSNLDHALKLEYLTVGWNVVEAVVAIGAGAAANSVALVGFGVDSVVESASGSILIWRLRSERAGQDSKEIEGLDRRARQFVALSLFALAAFVAGDAAHSLWIGERPEASPVGIAVTALSMIVMAWLARAKRRAAAALQSRAMEADAFQTSACWWLSVITLCGIGLNAALGWWWADPVAAMAMTVFLVKEGCEAWKGEECCGCA